MPKCVAPNLNKRFTCTSIHSELELHTCINLHLYSLHNITLWSPVRFAKIGELTECLSPIVCLKWNAGATFRKWRIKGYNQGNLHCYWPTSSSSKVWKPLSILCIDMAQNTSLHKKHVCFFFDSHKLVSHRHFLSTAAACQG